MKLGALANIKLGINIEKNLLTFEKKQDQVYFSVIRADDIIEGTGSFISQKDARKVPNYSISIFLEYGDILLYKEEEVEGKFKLIRFEKINKDTIAGNDIIVISNFYTILKDFFEIEKNKKRFFDEINQYTNIYNKSKIEFISKLKEIEIWTDNIKQLEEPSKSEVIGINEPIDLKDLPFNIVQKPLPMDKLMKRIELNELLIDAEFQRRPGLWKIETKSRFIESMIVRLPVPAFYFDGSNDDEWLIIDGLQRISTVYSYMSNNFALTDLVFLPKEFNGKTFNELDRSHQRSIEEFEIFAYIIQKGTPQKVKYKIFRNLNTSALVLERQEIRHALNPGIPAQLLKSIAEKEWFINSFGELLTKSKIDRMEDRELVLRYIAFQEPGSLVNYSPDINDFLDNIMVHLSEIPDTSRNKYEQELKIILKTINSIFGKKPFSRSLFDDSREYPLNTIIYELLTYSISLDKTENKNKLLNNIPYKDSVIKYFSDKKIQFWEYENQYSKENLLKRFKEIEVITVKHF